MRRFGVIQAAGAVLVLLCGTASAQVKPLEPFHDFGQGVTAAYEGWFQNKDGTYNLLFGYYSRNQKQELDIPVGPNNRVEPGGPDRGQPTHFLPARQWGVFTVTVPKDFGTNKLTWTLTANGQTNFVPASLDPLWEVQPFIEADKNTPPILRFEERGAPMQGPRPEVMLMNATVGSPLTLTVWASDDAKLTPGMRRPTTAPVSVTWAKFRGPGDVTFEADSPKVTPGEPQDGAAFSGTASTTATFAASGEYILEVTANDWSGRGGRGFQCCWTNAQVRVSVK